MPSGLIALLDDVATLTKLESKLAEVLGLAMAAQDAAREVRGMLGSEHDALAKKLTQARAEARETQERCIALAATFDGKKTAILEKGRETKGEASEMMPPTSATMPTGCTGSSS